MARIISSGLPSFVTPDRANLRIGINCTPSVTLESVGSGNTVTRNRSTSASNFAACDFYDSSNVYKSAFGYANASYGTALYASKAYIDLGSGVNFTLTDGTSNFLAVDRANGRIALGPFTTIDTNSVSHLINFVASLSGGNHIKIQNQHNAGYGAISFRDDANNTKASFGYGNSGAALTERVGRLFVGLGSGVDFNVIDEVNNVTVMRVKQSQSIQAFGLSDDTKQATVQTTDATVTTLLSFTPTADRTVVVSALIAGRKSDDTQGAGYEVLATFRVTGAGAVTQIGATTAVGTHEDDAAWAATIDTDATLIRIRVTGVAATTIKWTGHARWIYGAN